MVIVFCFHSLSQVSSLGVYLYVRMQAYVWKQKEIKQVCNTISLKIQQFVSVFMNADFIEVFHTICNFPTVSQVRS